MTGMIVWRGLFLWALRREPVGLRTRAWEPRFRQLRPADHLMCQQDASSRRIQSRTPIGSAIKIPRIRTDPCGFDALSKTFAKNINTCSQRRQASENRRFPCQTQPRRISR
jgi:hypothetical protein